MVDVFWSLVDHVRLEPVPQAQKVVRGPAKNERSHDHDGHFEGLQPGLGDVVILASGETWEGRNNKELTQLRGRIANCQMDGASRRRLLRRKKKKAD